MPFHMSHIYDLFDQYELNLCVPSSIVLKTMPFRMSHIYGVSYFHEKFSQAHHLNLHINAVHNGQKNHKCDSCGKVFPPTGHLKAHINAVHNGQKDYKCDLCEKEFSELGNLKRHINSVHNGQKDALQ